MNNFRGTTVREVVKKSVGKVWYIFCRGKTMDLNARKVCELQVKILLCPCVWESSVLGHLSWLFVAGCHIAVYTCENQWWA